MASEYPEPLTGVRRVVTGHRRDGIAVVKNDDTIRPVEIGLPGISVAAVWRTESLPANDNNDGIDGATRIPNGDLGLVMKVGTNLQITDLAPGAIARMHRSSSLDHNILLSGKLMLIMEDGSETLLDKPGDIVVQRGTIHGWKNPGPEWTRWITVVIDAKPAVVNGVALEPKALG